MTVQVCYQSQDNLFFFCWHNDIGKVIYADTETLEERFRELEDEDEEEETIEDVKIWDYFLGSDKSKIFGIYTHCQYEQKEIEEITFSDKILLLQIGENGFSNEGIFSVTIQREDLKKLNFDNC